MIDRLYRADEETKAQGSRNRLDFKTPAGAAHRWGQLEVTPEEPGLCYLPLSLPPALGAQLGLLCQEISTKADVGRGALRVPDLLLRVGPDHWLPQVIWRAPAFFCMLLLKTTTLQTDMPPRDPGEVAGHALGQ